MAKKKLFEDIRQSPSRFYRTPSDVLRDRRFADDERLEILRAWRDAIPDSTTEIDGLISEVEGRLVSHDHAAE